MCAKPLISALGVFISLSITPADAAVVQIWGGAREVIALMSDGSVLTWGYNSYGQIGNGSTVDQALAARVPNLTDVKAVMGAEVFNIALKSDGTVWTWGANNLNNSNAVYLLGIGPAYDSSAFVPSPTQISTLSNITLLGSRAYHAVVVKSDGTVWTWGLNKHFSLGMNNSTVTDTPNQVLGVSNPSMVTAGYNFSVALLQDKTLMSWGSDKAETLGNLAQYNNGSPNDSYTPVTVTGLTNIIDVSAGWEHVLALKSDGTVWAWGTNNWTGACGPGMGRLGIVDGSNSPVTDESVPTQIPTLTNVIQVSSGDGHSAVLKSDGTVWTFGANACGQLGNGDNSNAPQYQPVQVPGLTNVVWIAARDHHTQALKSDGTVWSWGSGEQGELGQACTPIPVSQVPSGSDCTNSNVALQTPIDPIFINGFEP
jgi:alpha-tubulin suppressor-like RCC1 family protein